MNRIIKYTIPVENNGLQVEKFLKQQGFSRPLLIHLKKTPEGICLNDTWCHTYDRVLVGDTLTVRIIEAKSSENIPPTYISEDDFRDMTVYEDEDILLINKPARLPVHPSLGHHEDTLANYCAYHYQKVGDGGFIFRCINRLDRDTSGIVLIAKNMLSGAILSTSLLNREIHRTYLAIVTGITPEKGRIDMPIARKDASVIERCIDYEHGERAVTNYERLYTDKNYSLLKINLETGRTHQIRVHMKAIGHPLPGDFLYNPDFSRIQRQALHSYSLEFNHPISKEPLLFTCDMPADMRTFVPTEYFPQ